METTLPWYRRLVIDQIPPDLAHAADHMLSQVTKDLNLEDLRIQWCEKDANAARHDHDYDTRYFLDEAIRFSHHYSTIYLRLVDAVKSRILMGGGL